jgi:hypothetical protein
MVPVHRVFFFARFCSMRPTLPSFRRRQAGLSLLEVLLALTISLGAGALYVDQIRSSTEGKQASATGQQLKEVGNALNTYVAMRFDKLVVLSNVGNSCPDINNTGDITMQGTGDDPGPRCCTGSVAAGNAICQVNSDTLRRNGLLPNSFSGYNAYGAKYQYYIRVQGGAPNYIVDGIVYTDQPYVTTGTTPRYDLLGAAMQEAGADSGMTRSVANRMDGLNGAWSDSAWPSINQLGLLGYRVGYGTSGFASYLRLDGSSAMTGDLLMGADDTHRHNINFVANLDAQTGTFKGNGTDNTSVLSLSNKGIGQTDFQPVTSNAATPAQVGGLAIRNSTGVFITSQAAATWAPLTAGTLTANGDINATTGTVNAKDLVLTDAAQSPKYTFTGTGGEGWVMNDTAWISTINGAGIKTAGEIQGGTLTAMNKLQVAGATATLGAACTNGTGIAMSSASSGQEVLQCRNGIWSSLGTTSRVVIGASTAGPGTSAVANCPTGYTLTGGGYRLVTYAPVGTSTSNAPDINIPNGTSQWFVFASAAAGNSTFQAYAVCSM